MANCLDDPVAYQAQQTLRWALKYKPWRWRKKIGKRLRARVFAEKGRYCTYCAEHGCNELDHVIPAKRGGKSEFENLVPCCGKCNSSKRDMTLDEWNVWKEARYGK
jgi:5-methylcytosine-specific restriction endonuclease McrA